MKWLIGLLLTVAGVLVAPSDTAAYRSCNDQSRDCPVEVRMARGTDTITLEGETSPATGCCAFAFRARGGQTLTWRLEGPASRVLFTGPGSERDGPGLPAAIILPSNGVYVFEVRPILMADDAYGRFRLTLTIR